MVVVAAVPGTAAAFLLLTAPGLIWSWWRHPAANAGTRITVGMGLGLALQLLLAAPLAATVGITRASVAGLTVALGVLAIAVALVRRPLRRHTRDPKGLPHLLQLALALAVIAAWQLFPLSRHTIPQGWDPSFHSLLASTTVATGKLPTWAPYEPIASNYPYGPHALMAEISLLTGIAPDQVFAALLNGVIPIITGLALYSFARRALRRHDIALGAVAAYGLLGNWGSIDYGAWGGLPNALGCFLLFVLLTELFAPGFPRLRVVTGGLLLGGIPIAHHHVMLTTVLLLAAYGAVLVAQAFFWGGSSGRRVARRQLTRLLVTGAVGLIVVADYAVPILLRAGQLGGTDVFRYFDHYDGLPFDKNGWALWILAVFGVVALVVPLYGWARVRQRGRGGAEPARLFIAVSCVALAVAFFLCYYVYRSYSLHRYGLPYTAFTPTRFLTDLTYFLALYAGVALAALWRFGASRQSDDLAVRLAGKDLGRPSIPARAFQVIARAGVVALLLITATVNLRTQIGGGAGQLAVGEREAFTWIKANTAPNALVVNLDVNARWAPYFTQREVAFTPVPISEFTAGYVNEKQSLIHALLDTLQSSGSQRVVGFLGEGTALNALMGRPMVALSDQPNAGLPGSPLYTSGFTAEPEQVYTLPDGLATLMPPAGGNAVTRLAHGAISGQITLPSGLTAPRVYCSAPGAITVRLDGAPTTLKCGGEWQSVPALSAPGAHILSVTIPAKGGSLDWFHLVVTQG